MSQALRLSLKVFNFQPRGVLLYYHRVLKKFTNFNGLETFAWNLDGSVADFAHDFYRFLNFSELLEANFLKILIRRCKLVNIFFTSMIKLCLFFSPEVIFHFGKRLGVSVRARSMSL